jgi:inward rectifier potassium channel
MAESNKKTWRLLNRDGSFNIQRLELPRGARRRDYYHRLLTLRWSSFFILLVGFYFLVNVFFGSIFFLMGPSALAHTDPTVIWSSPLGRFIECFFFSADIFATIGSGVIVPKGHLPNTWVTIVAFSGLTYIAILTGLVFARFSRATAKVIFSDKAVIQPIDGVPCLIARFANVRSNQIVEAKVSMTYAHNEVTEEGERFRDFGYLKLEENRSSMFVLSWTIVHPIDKTSPLYGLTQKDLVEKEAEFIIVMTGWDDTFAQTIHARFSYTPDDIRWNHRFEDIISRTPNNECVILNVRKINDVVPV